MQFSPHLTSWKVIYQTLNHLLIKHQKSETIPFVEFSMITILKNYTQKKNLSCFYSFYFLKFGLLFKDLRIFLCLFLCFQLQKKSNFLCYVMLFQHAANIIIINSFM